MWLPWYQKCCSQVPGCCCDMCGSSDEEPREQIRSDGWPCGVIIDFVEKERGREPEVR